jgi:hypothetical protein
MFAAVATSDARRLGEAGISSVSVAVAVPGHQACGEPGQGYPGHGEDGVGDRCHPHPFGACLACPSAAGSCYPVFHEINENRAAVIAKIFSRGRVCTVQVHKVFLENKVFAIMGRGTRGCALRGRD